MASSNCTEFRAHSVRSDKCRDCFGDRAQHSQAQVGQTGASQLLNMSNNHDSNKDEPIASGDAKQGNRCAMCEEKQTKLEQLEDELRDWKQRCLDSESSCNEAREELKTLENEMEEMKDSFREEESVQFEQLKKDFESEAKKSKILQFRLNKCERQCTQLEQINLSLERQVEDLKNQQQETSNRSRSPNQAQQQQQQQQQQAFVQLGADFVKLSTAEYDQLLRDLNDTSERERDLQEQVKFAQEEAHCKGDRLQAVEVENEVLLGRVGKLTLANSRLKSNLLSGSKGVESSPSRSPSDGSGGAADDDDLAKVLSPRDLYEQNEQFRLALEMAQAECGRLNSKLQANAKLIESKEETVRKLEQQLREQETSSSSADSTGAPVVGQQSRLELECRQLRARLVHSERECRQLKAQIELLIASGSQQVRNAHLASGSRSQSLETSGGTCCKCGAKCNEINRRLEERCQLMQTQREELQRRVDQMVRERGNSSRVAFESSTTGESVSSMEADLLDKLKKQLDLSESELAKARSRLVELDLRCSQAQRQYKDLLSSLESYSADQQVVALQRMRSRAPTESQSESMGRAELRQVVRDLEANLDELIGAIRVKNSLIDELKTRLETYETNDEAHVQLHQQRNAGAPVEEQLKSVRRQLDQERLTTSNLKIDVANLEEQNEQMRTQVTVNERKCIAMTEELDQMRRVSGELRAELEEARRQEQCALVRTRDYELIISDLRKELADARKLSAQVQTSSIKSKIGASSGGASPDGTRSQQNDILLLTRDLSELKVKNGFLMRQLEIAREDTAKQLDELRSNADAQQRQAVEVAQLELREKQLVELQGLRDEIGDLKQKLSNAQRQLARQEEETNSEREKVRSVERDWRRDKSQWRQKYEQLEAQLAIERRTSEFRSKEADSIVRDKDRQLIGVQDRCVQVERDLKRLQNKYSLLEENCDTRVKSLSRDLELKLRELAELSSLRQQVDERHFVECRRLQTEKSTLTETLDSLRRSYDERSAELKSVRDLLIVRQEQAYRERASAQERVESLSEKLDEMSEHETQCKLLRQRMETLERHLESAREERSRLKTRCDELERKCAQYEKRELIGKTTSIVSGASSSFLRFGHLSSNNNSSGSSGATRGGGRSGTSAQSGAANNTVAGDKQTDPTINNNETSVVERLSGKINDQRHLINMLRQQLNETQLELKQMKLLQSSERSKWQTKCTLLTSRLNECEERLAFETALLIGDRSPAMSASSTGLLDKVVRPKLEQQWSKERDSTMRLMQQQQSQIEMLSRDLKQISQAHDLLRLQGKQLESHNSKLSKKLIEYQQQQQQQQQLVASPRSESNRSASSKQVSELEARTEQLKRANDRLREHARPLVKIMSKVVSSLESPQINPAAVETQTNAKQSDTGEVSSMSRPLHAGDAMTMAAIAQSKAHARQPGDTTPAESSSAPVPQRSRLARLLGASQKPTGVGEGKKRELETSVEGKKSAVRKVRIKSSTLGITPTEKRQLKEHLRELSAAMDLTSTLTNCDTTSVATSSASGQPSHSKESQNQSSKTSPIKPTAADLYLRHVVGSPAMGGSQTRALVSGSLTDYEESESSLASYGFAPPASGLLGGAGAESDSGLTIAPGGSSMGNKLGDRKRRGFKNKLTSTLRNLSRSITAGLGSDSETEGSVASQNEYWYDKSKRKTLAKRTLNDPNVRQASVESELSVQSELGLATRSGSTTRDVSARASSALREIRV